MLERSFLRALTGGAIFKLADFAFEAASNSRGQVVLGREISHRCSQRSLGK